MQARPQAFYLGSYQIQPGQPQIRCGTPRYTDAAVAALRGSGYPVDDADVVRLSPLIDRHINLLGRYSFASRADRRLRPLRDPTAPDDD